MMFTEKQQEIADRILKDLSAQNFIWESDYMSDLQMQYPQNYHDCDYVMESLIRDYRLLERYGKGYLKLTLEGMKATDVGFINTIKRAETEKRLPIIEHKLRIVKIIIDIAIAIASFILGRCSTSLF